MIDVNYVNDTQKTFKLDPMIKFEHAIDEIMSDFDFVYNEYTNALRVYDLNAFFLEDAVDTEKVEYLIEKEDNFINKLGQSIINIFKKAVEAIGSILDKLKEKFSGNKEKFSKAAAICKQNPSLEKYLTAEVKKALDNGDMNITDIKALAELDKSYNELVELSKKKDCRPDSLKAKWEAAVKKFENIDKKPIIASAVSVAVIITTFSKANDAIRESKVNMSDSLSRMMDWSVNNGNAGDLNNKGAFRILADAARYTSHQHIAAANEANSISTFIANRLDAVVNRVSPDTATNMRRNLVRAAAQNREQRDYERQRQRQNQNNP